MTIVVESDAARRKNDRDVAKQLEFLKANKYEVHLPLKGEPVFAHKQIRKKRT